MQVRFNVALLIACCTLSASASQTEDSARITSEYRKMEFTDFCMRLGRTLRNAPEKSGAVRYNVMLKLAEEPDFGVRPIHHDAIRKRSPAIGMSVCSVFAALGRPESNNRTVTSRGERYQLIYRNPKRYVYLDNFIVSGWQE